MLKINRDEYGDRAVNEANKIISGCMKKKSLLKYKLIFVMLLASALFVLVLKLI